MTKSTQEVVAKALWADGNNRIGHRPWDTVKNAYMAEAGHAIAALVGSGFRIVDAAEMDKAGELYQDALADLVDALEERKRLRAALLEVERHCPCGARPESLNTHPHVIGCPVARALGSRTVADNYNDAVYPQNDAVIR